MTDSTRSNSNHGAGNRTHPLTARDGAALRNSGFRGPLVRVIVNLAPADRRKEGPAFDLPIALGIDAYCRGRDGRAGAWVGVAAACKATPLLFAVPWAVQRRFLAGVGLVRAFERSGLRRAFATSRRGCACGGRARLRARRGVAQGVARPVPRNIRRAQPR